LGAKVLEGPSPGPRGSRRRSAGGRLLGLWVRNPPGGGGTDVCLL